MSDQLKPCPICGSKAEVRKAESWWEAWCLAYDGEGQTHNVTTTGQTRASAIASWNRRAPTEPAEVVEIHAETLIALAAWCASDLSDGDVAAAVAEVRAFVAAADPTALICNAPPPSSREELGARIANLVPTDGELVCARCGSPWGMRHSETCKNVPAPVAAKERP